MIRSPAQVSPAHLVESRTTAPEVAAAGDAAGGVARPPHPAGPSAAGSAPCSA